MESLNLNQLASSLPNSNLANAEADLTNNFKAAALSLTTLYKSARKTSKRAYNAGYSSACQDLLLMIQQGVSAGESSQGGGAMTIGRIMDYIEARLEAIKSQEEEDEEDEERERDRGRSAPAAAPLRAGVTPATPRPLPAAVSALRIPKDQTFSMPQTPAPVTPSPLSLRSSSAPIPPSSNAAQRAMKSKLSSITSAKDISSILAPVPSTSFSMGETTVASPVAIFPSMPPSEPTVQDISTGMKRRHNMIFDSTPGASPMGTGNTRRRTRSNRGTVQDQNQTQSTDDMDVEEEGRERKRVARR